MTQERVLGKVSRVIAWGICSLLMPATLILAVLNASGYYSTIGSLRYTVDLSQDATTPTEVKPFTEVKGVADIPEWVWDERLVVLTGSDITYAQVLVNFLLFQLDLFTLLDVRIVCMDAEFKKWLVAHGGTCQASVDANHLKISKIWQLRSKAVADLLAQNHTVLMSDADAIWLKNPLPYLDPSRGQVVAQKGTFPEEIAAKLGGTAVMGFALLRPTQSVQQFWKAFPMRTPDDQRGFNAGLVNGQFKTIKGQPFKKPWGTFSLQYEMKNDRDKCGPAYSHCAQIVENGMIPQFNVTLLSKIKFLRGFCRNNKLLKRDTTVLAHCLTSKTASGKKHTLAASNLYMIPLSWNRQKLDKMVPYEEGTTFFEWLHQVRDFLVAMKS